MEISITKEELSKALYLTQSVVEKRTTMPILANVLLSASDGQLQISATDLEVTAVAQADAEIASGGSTTVSAKVLSDIVKELPDGEVRIQLSDGERLEISAGNSKFKMIGVSSEEYPTLPGVDLEVRSKISSGLFLEMINKTLYAVSHDETRFNLNGVCFDSTELDGKNALRMVATDGHRLSLITREVENLECSEKSIVPRKGLSELRKILEPDTTTEIGIDIREGFLVVEAGDAKISMRLIDGEFPDFEQVVPKEEGALAVMDNQQLSQAVRRAALMVTDKGKCVKLDFSENHLRISSSSPELGEANEAIQIEYSGEPLSVGFNARYLLDFANSLEESKNVCLELNGELGAGKLYGQGDPTYIGIVMPMRLN